MADRFDMWRTFTGRSGRVERRGTRAQMEDMERRLGGSSAAARAAGVNRGTWWRIKTGRTRAPRPETAQRVRAAHRQHFSTEGRRALVGAATSPRRRITGYGPRFHGSYVVNGYARSAPFRFYSDEARYHLAAAQDAFLAADDEGARAELNAALSAEIGHPTEALDGEVEWT